MIDLSLLEKGHSEGYYAGLEEKNSILAKKDVMLAEKDDMLEEKDAIIENLKKQLDALL